MFAHPELFSEFIKHTPLSSNERIIFRPFFVDGSSVFTIIDDADVGMFLIDEREVMFFCDNDFIRDCANRWCMSYDESRLSFHRSFTARIERAINGEISPIYEADEPKKLKVLCKATECGDCLICLNKCSKNNHFKLECACKYSCHKKCIEKWLCMNNKCPICSK